MVNAINLNTEEAEAEDFCGFETALFYVVNFMKARATWCNAVLKKKRNKRNKKEYPAESKQSINGISVQYEMLIYLLSIYILLIDVCNSCTMHVHLLLCFILFIMQHYVDACVVCAELSHVF